MTSSTATFEINDVASIDKLASEFDEMMRLNIVPVVRLTENAKGSETIWQSFVQASRPWVVGETFNRESIAIPLTAKPQEPLKPKKT